MSNALELYQFGTELLQKINEDDEILRDHILDFLDIVWYNLTEEEVQTLKSSKTCVPSELSLPDERVYMLNDEQRKDLEAAVLRYINGGNK